MSIAAKKLSLPRRIGASTRRGVALCNEHWPLARYDKEGTDGD